MGLLDILKQYAEPNSTPTGDVFGHFDTVAQKSPQNELGSGIAAALRSGGGSSFEQTIGNLFSQSNPEQKAGLLNEFAQFLGPAGLASAGGGMLSRILGTGNSPGSSYAASPASPASTLPNTQASPVTPTQAAQVSPTDVGSLAAAARQQDRSIVDRLGNFYAQHPTLVKTMGVAALGAVMSHMSSLQRA